jgi:hypothetical protein
MKSTPSRFLAPIIYLVIANILLTGCSKKPDATVKQFFRELNAGRVDDAASFIIKPKDPLNQIAVEARKMLLENSHDGDTTMLGAACSAARENGGYVVDILRVHSEDKFATVLVRLGFNWNFPPWETEFKLVKRDKQWRIVEVPYTIVMTGMSFRLYRDFDTRVLVGLPQDY